MEKIGFRSAFRGVQFSVSHAGREMKCGLHGPDRAIPILRILKSKFWKSTRRTTVSFRNGKSGITITRSLTRASQGTPTKKWGFLGVGAETRFRETMWWPFWGT